MDQYKSIIVVFIIIYNTFIIGTFITFIMCFVYYIPRQLNKLKLLNLN